MTNLKKPGRNKKIPIIGLGAGGHAKVVVDILQLMGKYEVIGLLDSDSKLASSSVLGVPVLGTDQLLEKFYKDGVRHVFLGVGAGGGSGKTIPRQSLFERAQRTGFEVVSAIHPQAIISPHARLGSGATVMAGAIINAGASLGLNVIVNTGAIVEHDCVIGDHAHIATGAHLAGGVSVGPLAHVGIGATVRQGLTIGQGAVVAAGAVVVKDVPAQIVVAGVPAVPLKSSKQLAYN